MELPHLGKNCSICNRNDYLPFKCSHCDKIVCIDHKFDHGPQCPLQQTPSSTTLNIIEDNKVPSDLQGACGFCHKITLRLELTQCECCNINHCLHHRHQVQHDCPKLRELELIRKKDCDEVKKKQSDALDKLKTKLKHHELSSTTSVNKTTFSSQIVIDPKKLALNRRVRIMKIKQFAKGPPNINIEDRIYLEVRFIHEQKAALSNPSKDNYITKIFTSPKHTLGRLIDWSAQEINLTNKNHTLNCDQLEFQLPTTDGNVKLDSQAKFSRYIDTGELASGDEIILTYVPVSN